MRSIVMLLISGATLLATGSVVGASSEPGDSTEPAGNEVDLELVASLTTQGLFPVRPPFLPASPRVAVYADGTVLVPGDVGEALVQPFMRGTVDAHVVARVQETAETSGLLAEPPAYPPNLAMADAPRTWLVVADGAAQYAHVVDGLTDAEANPARAAVADMTAGLNDVAAGVEDDVEPFEITAIAVQARAVEVATEGSTSSESALAAPVEWLDEGVDLASAQLCSITDDPATVSSLIGAMAGQTFEQDGVTYAVAARPVLPGHGCLPGEAPAPR